MEKSASLTLAHRLGATRIVSPALALGLLAQLATAQIILPGDAKPTCAVAPAEFATWFASGSVGLNGAVNPADSIAFSDLPNCDFYKWSEQMFLWLTSPSATGDGTHVFDTPVFFDVSLPDASGKRTFIPHTPGSLRNFSASIPQRGPNEERVVFDQTGEMFTVVQHVGRRVTIIRDLEGRQVEIQQLEATPEGQPLFRDSSGNAIPLEAAPNQSPRLIDNSGREIELSSNRITVNGEQMLLTTSGDVLDLEFGQADKSVLMAQNNSLVYYSLQTNDVFAYFLTGTKNGGITPAPTQFPTKDPELDAIKQFASTHSTTFTDANALTIELKSAWIETTGLDASQYVIVNATIPTYDTSDPAHWVPKGTRQAELALVGIHVVGSTVGHPEMVWATVEHVNNALNEQYSYLDATDAMKTVPKNTAGTWLLSTSGATGPANNLRMRQSGADIKAVPGQTIGPSDVLRINPWGTAAASGENVSNNTDIIAINNSVIGQLAAGDVRKNYIMTGATWTIDGAAPDANNQVGTNQMANATMETFFQPSNCFDCHATNKVGVSHIFTPLQPLFP